MKPKSVKQVIYINGIGNISPQATFDLAQNTAVVKSSTAFMACQEPSYKQYIPRKQLRRMSRAVRMGLTVAHKALEEAQPSAIDAIITGTAWGCVKDTEKFLETIIENNEQYLTPTAFVQSTHNTVAGQIALMHHCNCYNMTYVQGAVSFESALLDAQLLFMDNQAQNIIVAGVDEQTEQLQLLLKRLSCARIKRPMGEGAACFVLSTQAKPNSYAKLLATRMIYRPQNQQVLEQQVLATLKSVALSPASVDLVLSGSPHSRFEKKLFPTASIIDYKQLCGAYPTSTAFATAMAAKAIIGDPYTCHILSIPTKIYNNVLIYNQDQDTYHSLILLSST